MEYKEQELYSQEEVDRIYQSVLQEHPQLSDIPAGEIKALALSSLSQISNLERIGEKDKSRLEIPNEILMNIGAIWIFSGPGTYDSATKDDKFNTFSWARWMDRDRLNYGAMLARKIANTRSGENNDQGGLSTLGVRKEKIKQKIERFGPQIIYNGTQLEDDTLADVLKRTGTIIPEDKVDIIRGNIVNTLDQVKTFKLPADFLPEQELAIVSHAPHLVRIMHMIGANPPFPERTKVRLFPLPTAIEGKEQYAMMETQGLIRYGLLDKVASIIPYPYHTS